MTVQSQLVFVLLLPSQWFYGLHEVARLLKGLRVSKIPIKSVQHTLRHKASLFVFLADCDEGTCCTEEHAMSRKGGKRKKEHHLRKKTQHEAAPEKTRIGKRKGPSKAEKAAAGERISRSHA